MVACLFCWIDGETQMGKKKKKKFILTVGKL